MASRTVKNQTNGNGSVGRRSMAIKRRLSKPATASPPVKRFKASVFPDPRLNKPLPESFVEQIQQLEAVLKMPVWFVVQNGRSEWGEISGTLFKGIQAVRSDMPPGEPIALLIESPGGDPDFAFRIARMLQRCSNNQLTVIVPQFAKSAATLIALGAKHIILGRDAELGPLDVQIFDFDREDYGSALNTVQSLERLNAFATAAIDQTMVLLARRTGKRTDVLLPFVLEYVANFLRPLLEKIDTADYTKKSRDLKLTEEYAVRLMRANYPFAVARRIARQLVEKYPTHGFVIDKGEASSLTPVSAEGETFGIGLSLCKTLAPADEEKAEQIFEKMVEHLD